MFTYRKMPLPLLKSAMNATWELEFKEHSCVTDHYISICNCSTLKDFLKCSRLRSQYRYMKKMQIERKEFIAQIHAKQRVLLNLYNEWFVLQCGQKMFLPDRLWKFHYQKNQNRDRCTCQKNATSMWIKRVLN